MGSRRIPILLYHSVSDHASKGFRRWNVAPDQFAEHMAFLVEHGYHAMTVTDLVDAIRANREVPPRAVVVTFDDGFADFYDNALPTLTSLGLPATLYVSTAYVGRSAQWLRRLGEGQRPMLTLDQLRAAADYGIEIGAHSHWHLRLDELPANQARRQIEYSRTLLEQFGLRVQSFAFPYGFSSRLVRSLTINAGFTSACGVRHAMSSVRDDTYGLSRIIVSDTTGTMELDALLRGFGLPTAPFGEQLRTRVWRRTRRAAVEISRFAGHRPPEFEDSNWTEPVSSSSR